MSYLQRIADAYTDVHLSKPEMAYYARHLLLPGIGKEGQQKLKAARVLVIGAGGLGCPALQALAGSGVGQLTVVDGDVVAQSNLARQWLHTPDDVDLNKAESAQRAVAAMNPYVQAEVVSEMLTPANAEALIAAHDLVIDATDDMEVRYLIDEVCAQFDRPWVHAALYRSRGQICTFWETYGARFKHMYPEKSEAPSCSGAGILGASASVIANYQALEAVKLITACATAGVGKVVSIDTFSMQQQVFTLPGVFAPEVIEAVDRLPAHSCTVDELRQRRSIAEPIRLIDIRSAKLHAQGAIPDSEFLDVDDLLQTDFSGRQRVVLYCEEGSISGLIADALRSRNADTVFHLEGGYRAWQESS